MLCSLLVCVLYTYTYIIHIYLCLCVFTCVCNSVRIYISIFVCPFESPPPRTQRLHRTSRIVCVCLCTHAYTTPHTRLPHPLSAHARKTSSVKLDTHSRALSVRMMYVCSAYCKLDGVVETRAPLSSRTCAGKRSPLHTHVYMYVYTITECRAIARESERAIIHFRIFAVPRKCVDLSRERERIRIYRCAEMLGRGILWATCARDVDDRMREGVGGRCNFIGSIQFYALLCYMCTSVEVYIKS